MIDLAISIVLYKSNTSELSSLLEFCKNLKLSHRVYIFDNSFDENIKNYCLENNYKYRSSAVNIGFGRGHNNNLLVNSIPANAYLILNPDITLSSLAIESLYQRLLSSEETFLVAPKLLYPSNDVQYTCRLLPTLLSILKRRLFYTHFYNSYLDECKFTNYNKVLSPPFIHGACYMIKSNIFKSVNGFDERFFLYMEDVDLYRRINKNNNALFIPNIEAKHVYGRGSRKNVKLFFLHLISLVKYFNKWNWILDKERDIINKKFLEKNNL